MASQKKITVIIADDHTLVRRGLVTLLSLNKDVEVIAEVGDGRVAIEITLEKKPDVVMMDLSMPNLSGFEAIRQIKRRAPQVKSSSCQPTTTRNMCWRLSGAEPTATC
jgi:DNA-binding NarL/FixJ family response regulator